MEIAHDFAFHPQAVLTPQQLVLRIHIEHLGPVFRCLPVGGGGENDPEQFLAAPTLLHEFASQPVEQFGVFWFGAAHTEIGGGGDQSLTEEFGPDAVDRDPRCQWISGTHQPAGKVEARGVLWISGLQWLQHGQCRRDDLFLGLEEVAAIKQMCGAWIDTAAGDDARIHERWFRQFRLGGIQGARCGQHLRIHFFQPVPKRLDHHGISPLGLFSENLDHIRRPDGFLGHLTAAEQAESANRVLGGLAGGLFEPNKKCVATAGLHGCGELQGELVCFVRLSADGPSCLGVAVHGECCIETFLLVVSLR